MEAAASFSGPAIAEAAAEGGRGISVKRRPVAETRPERAREMNLAKGGDVPPPATGAFVTPWATDELNARGSCCCGIPGEVLESSSGPSLAVMLCDPDRRTATP